MASPARVLYVDDDEEMVDLVEARLGRAGGLSVVTARTVDAGIDHLEDGEIECVVCDYVMPEMDGLELLELVRERDPDLPFVLFTGKGSEHIASEAISAGVTDYMQKSGRGDTFEVLANRVENAVQRYRAERALRESERRYRTLVERSHDAIYIYRGNQFVFVNDRMCELTGYSEEELYRTEVLSLIHPDDREWLRRMGRSRRRGEDVPSTYEARILTADGETKVLALSVQRIDREGDPAVLGSARDVTDRKRREAALERYETIVQASGDPVYTLDAEGVMTFANDRLVEISGFGEDELLGEHVSMVMDDDDVETGAAVIRELLQSDDRERSTFEMALVTAEGERIPCENHLALLTGEDGAFRGTTGVLRDITARQERERELERQNERLSEFARVVSHDLRNPLNVASLSIEIAREEPEATHFDRAESAIDRMDELIDDLLRIAQGDRGEVDAGPAPLESVVETAWGTTRTAGASLEIVGELGTVECDESRTGQLFENLFRNAVEHAGPDVTVRVGPLEADGEGGDGAGSPAGFFVEDDGPGFAEDDDDRLFSMGYSTASDGTGFGLAIVEDVVHAHGWSIRTAVGELGGARFEVTGVEAVDVPDGRDGPSEHGGDARTGDLPGDGEG